MESQATLGGSGALSQWSLGRQVCAAACRFAGIKLIIICLNIAWFDGAAIYLAVLIVSGFSAFVDYRKEKEFVKRSQDDEDGKKVSYRNSSTTCPKAVTLMPHRSHHI